MDAYTSHQWLLCFLSQNPWPPVTQLFPYSQFANQSLNIPSELCAVQSFEDHKGLSDEKLWKNSILLSEKHFGFIPGTATPCLSTTTKGCLTQVTRAPDEGGPWLRKAFWWASHQNWLLAKVDGKGINERVGEVETGQKCIPARQRSDHRKTRMSTGTGREAWTSSRNL